MISNKEYLSHQKYRPDIDGLRAIAVLSVVAFHAFPNWVRGGFIGVDVFFVISGYLISTIIFEKLDEGNFSFLEFYSRRIRRIFPALLVVLVFCFVFGWFFLLADEYKQLGKHIAAGTVFLSNFILWKEAGYFDNSAETKPLLHLWSLGVEEQFYLAWPMLLWLAWKGRFNLITIAIGVTIASFALNVRGVKQDAVYAFYLPHNRFWELLCGSVLAWFALDNGDGVNGVKYRLDVLLSHILYRDKHGGDGKTLANVISFLGLFLLLYGFWTINKQFSFPGKWALVPVLGAVLIIAAGSSAWVNRTILSNKIAVWIGLISFPIYLWHWPLLAFARIVEGDIPSRNIRISVVVISVLFAWLTYKLVERPLRFGKHSKVKTSALVVLMIIFGCAGFNIYHRDGLSFRAYNKKFSSYNDSIKIYGRAKECFDIPYAYKITGDWFCDLGDARYPIGFFAYGDSHALSLMPALEEFASNNKLRVQFAGTSGCPSVLGVQSLRSKYSIEVYNCKNLNERVFAHVKNSGIKSVILISRWTYYTGSLSRPKEFIPVARDVNVPIDKASSARDLFWAMQNTVRRYSSIGVKVVFIEDNPQQLYEPRDILRKGGGVEAEYLKLSVATNEHRENQKRVNEALRKTGAKVVNLDDILCTEDICPLVANSRFLYSDDDHLSITGAFLVSKPLSVRLK